MKLESIRQLKEELFARGQTLRPISEKELARIQASYKKPLPKVYEEFLLQMGKEAGSFMRGSSAFYVELFELKEWASELLQENKVRALPEDAFVFWMHQGYLMAFFILGESDNPMVYYFGEGSGLSDFIKVGTLLEFFEKQLKSSGFDISFGNGDE